MKPLRKKLTDLIVTTAVPQDEIEKISTSDLNTIRRAYQRPAMAFHHLSEIFALFHGKRLQNSPHGNRMVYEAEPISVFTSNTRRLNLSPLVSTLAKSVFYQLSFSRADCDDISPAMGPPHEWMDAIHHHASMLGATRDRTHEFEILFH
jgi:hypothetical protein